MHASRQLERFGLDGSMYIPQFGLNRIRRIGPNGILENFAGTAVIISHDRWFLDRLATHIIAFEGDAKIHFHNGNWSSYEEERRKRFGEDADQPHRLKFRKLTRD